MPAPQLFAGAIETLFNNLLKLDENSSARLIPLQGKKLRVTLTELPWPLGFVFSSKVDVLMEDPKDASPADCSITLQLGTLNELRDSSQITRLIQEKRLELDGDIHVAQHFSQLIKELDIDWEEHLSRNVGDVAAHNIWSFAKQAKSQIQQGLMHLGNMLKEGVVEEKQLLPHQIEVNKYLEDVSLLRGDVGRLEARIESLSNKLKK